MIASVFVGVSVDGFIARVDGGLDWLPDDCEPHGYEEFIAAVDALVMGRNTYEIVLAFGEWPYGEKPVFVLSTNKLEPATESLALEQMSGEPADIVSQLADRGIGHIYVDGGITIQRFLHARLIQRLIITRIPVLIGDGIPLFGSLPADVRLVHIGTRHFPSGLVQSEYHVPEAAGPDVKVPTLW